MTTIFRHLQTIVASSRAAWRMCDNLLMRGAGTLFGGAAIIIAYYLGRADASGWTLLISALFLGACIGAAEDRAETRAKTEWADRFLRMIANNHSLDITVTHVDRPGEGGS